MSALFNNPNFQAVMMLIAAISALDCARDGQPLLASVQMACSAFWMFRLWGGLRAQKQGEGQS